MSRLKDVLTINTRTESCELSLTPPITTEMITELSALLLELNSQYPAYRLELRCPNISPDQASVLLNTLHQQAGTENITMLINVRDWNKTSYMNKADRICKALYRELQNIILDNGRKARAETLRKNIQPLYEIASKEIAPPPKISFEKNLYEAIQPFDGPDITYPLTSKTPGIQQQYQQQVIEELEQQTAEQEESQQQILLPYEGDITTLISRENIDNNPQCKAIWNHLNEALSEEERKSASWRKKPLSQLFSLWVGSSVNASHVIEHIETHALEKIMQYASQFRFGISQDNLPPGFYLAHSSNKKGLILCFDQQREKDTLQRQINPSSVQYDPLTVLLHPPEIGQAFQGDFRQFIPFLENVPGRIASEEARAELQGLWTYLTIDDSNNDDDYRENTYQILKDAWLQKNPKSKIYLKSAMHNSILEQRFNCYDEVECDSDYRGESCWWLIKNCGKAIISSEFAEALTYSTNTSRKYNPITENNIRSLGQLFNTYGISGLHEWFFLANQIFTHFGVYYYNIWKKRILDPVDNWEDCLKKREIEALAHSIQTLKSNLPLQEIWWKLVDKHGAATGRMNYADLWFAFQKTLSLLEKNHLDLYSDKIKKAFCNYLDKSDDFNGLVFLDRLHRVLKHYTALPHPHAQQQNLLEHLDIIDWHHNGLYYAMQYEEYPYWHDTLQLTAFHSPLKATKPSSSYQVCWDGPIPIKEPITQALRFISQRMQFSIADFKKFEQLLQQCNLPIQDAPNSDTLLAPTCRLLSACLSVGMDRLDRLKNAPEMIQRLRTPELQWVLNWFEHAIVLDAELIPGTMCISLQDIVAFTEVMNELELQPYLQTLSQPDALAFINACGRAFAYYHAPRLSQDPIRDDPKAALRQLLITVKARHPAMHTELLYDPLLTCLPWVVNEPYRSKDTTLIPQNHSEPPPDLGIQLLHVALRAIDFTQSSWLPSHDVIHQAYIDIQDAKTPKEKQDRCQRILTDWSAHGCAITYQEINFRALQDRESEKAWDYLEDYLPIHFKEENKILIQTLLRDHLAIKADTAISARAQLETLLRLFVRLDNKPYYNQLAQIIGTLLMHAHPQKEGESAPLKRYAVPQLILWLKTLIDENQLINQHYPVNLLNELLLVEASHQDSTLLNSQLDKLEENAPSHDQQSLIATIAHDSLPDQYKPVLLKLALQANTDQAFQYITHIQEKLSRLLQNQASPDWLHHVTQLIHFLESQKNMPTNEKALIIECLSTPYHLLATVTPDDIELFAPRWQSSQIKWIEWVLAGKISSQTILSNALNLKNGMSHTIHFIQRQSIDESTSPIIPWDDELGMLLNKRTPKELQTLARYYTSDPHPNRTLLKKLLQATNPPFSIDDLIHHFETVEQGLNFEGKPKRQYSLAPENIVDLSRVLAGFKQKGKQYIADNEAKELLNLLYYTNHYSQIEQLDTLPLSTLQAELQKTLSELKNDTVPHQQHQASARLLACIREVLLRKSGKWVNHTQMLDLLYAALHNDDSLLHQIRTGEGKSIITIMRSAYLALNGYIVDACSAKESLSKRDHTDFAPVLDGLGIRHAYITPHSSATDYQNHSPSSDGIGAVNYATIGNFSLFYSLHAWEGKTPILPHSEKHVAFLDEADYILTDETTQFNYSANEEGDSLYNLDEWVYKHTYDFYLTHQDAFTKNADGTNLVSRNQHLKLLCECLQQHAKEAPESSRFFKKYIAPALSNNPETIKKRDLALLGLLTAAQTAHYLKENVDFSIRPEWKSFSDNRRMDTRFAKVVIHNQIQQGATYSDMVHQFLHKRLNKEAAERGEVPNFFIDPLRQIALSMNAPYLLKKQYGKIEGCTGTTGNRHDLARYEEHYGISHIIKLPTHETLKTDFLPNQFCNNSAEQIDTLVSLIIKNPNRPILITCQDDLMVKALAEKVRAQLIERNYDRFDQFIVDTNDSGKPEQRIVPLAGLPGTTTFSARMGRGTDITPPPGEGLMVLRTYPTIPRTEKQERGRQGRHGASGTCQDIIDFSEVKKAWDAYYNSPQQPRLLAIQREQEQHLAEKIQKHTVRKSTKWLWLAQDPLLQQQYTQTRTVQELKEALKQEQEQYLRQKEAIVAILSGNIMTNLNHYIAKKRPDLHELLREQWLECIKNIDTLWNARLADASSDSHAIYSQFIHQVDRQWQAVCASNVSLDRTLVQTHIKSTECTQHDPIISNASPSRPPVSIKPQIASDLPLVTEFYQKYIRNTQTYLIAPPTNHSTISAIWGPDRQYLNGFYHMLHTVSYQEPFERRQGILKKLIELMERPAAHCVSTQAWSAVLERLMSVPDSTRDANYLACLDVFFNQPWLIKQTPKIITTTDIAKNNQLFTLSMQIVTTGYTAQSVVNLTFIHRLCKVIHLNFWANFEEKSMLAEAILVLAGTEPAVSTLLQTHLNEADIAHLLTLLKDKAPQAPDVIALKHYLTTHADSLNQHPHLLRPLFTLALTPQNQKTANHLPDPTVLDSLTGASPICQDLQNKFWHFLTQRQPILKADCQALIELLSEPHSNEDEFIRKVVEPLLALPPYLRIDTILQQLKHAPGKYHLDDSQTIIKGLSEAAEAFNQYLLKQSHGAKIKLTTDVKAWQNIFAEQTTDRNIQFFKQALLLENILQDIPAATSDLKTIETQFFQAINESPPATRMATINHWQQWINLLHDKREFLDHASLMALLPSHWDEDLAISAQEAVKEPLNVLQQIDQFEKKYGLEVMNLRQTYLSDIKGNTAHYNRLLPLLIDPSCSLGKESIHVICQHCFTNKVIQTSKELTQLISVTRQAEALKENEDYQTIFSKNASTEKQLTRVQLMQYLFHNLINLGDVFRHRCENEYQKLLEKTVKLPEKELHRATLTERVTLFKTHYHQLMQCCKEIMRIATHPTSRETRADSAVGLVPNTEIVNSHRRIFQSQQKQYASSFWRSSDRKIAAKRLFQNLSNISGAASTLPRETYYLNALNTIWTTQEALLTDDIGKQRNKKGFSRLYDITAHLFITVARDYVTDEDLPIDKKIELSFILKVQLQRHIEILALQLPQNNKLKHTINRLVEEQSHFTEQWKEGSTQLAELREELAMVKLKTIPSHLHYLINHLGALTDLTSTIAQENTTRPPSI